MLKKSLQYRMARLTSSRGHGSGDVKPISEKVVASLGR
jgi:hypothetical protein